MSCPYYWWDNDYACRKTGKPVSEDVYYKYCRNYDYRDCPIYKDESSHGGCYLTSACIESCGLPDNCTELTVLRNFRDNWLKKQPGGLEEIAEYYAVAPRIVEQINAVVDAGAVWKEIYENIVIPCLAYIQHGEMEQARKLYREEARKLELRFGGV